MTSRQSHLVSELKLTGTDEARRSQFQGFGLMDYRIGISFCANVGAVPSIAVEPQAR